MGKESRVVQIAIFWGTNQDLLIAKSQAVLVKSNELTNEQIQIVNKLLFRLKSVLRAKKSRYILLNDVEVPNLAWTNK